MTFLHFPVQTVLLARVANELHRVLFRGLAFVKLRVVFRLSVSRCLTGLYDGQFIAADAAGQNLILSRSRVKVPLPSLILLQRDRKGKIVRPDQQDLGTIRHFGASGA